MIKNKSEYKRTKDLATELNISLMQLKFYQGFKALAPLAQRAYRASLKRQFRQLNQELQDYERLKSDMVDVSTNSA